MLSVRDFSFKHRDSDFEQKTMLLKGWTRKAEAGLGPGMMPGIIQQASAVRTGPESCSLYCGCS
jgi:hypothetical protein